MTINNPRMLIMVLEDLQHVISRWMMRASDTISTALYIQRQSEEKARRALHRAQIMQDQAERDREAVTDQQEKITSLLLLARDAEKAARKTLTDVNLARKQAQHTLDLWQTELKIALKWLDRAKERLRRALEDLAAAKSELASAERELSHAEWELRNCQNSYTVDSEDRRHYKDCSGARARVVHASERVSVAKLWIIRAQEEVRAAQAEVERAKARVRCCQTAVGHSERAASLAEEAKQRANMAINAAERSIEHAEAAEKNAQQAEQRTTQEEEEAELMMQNVRLAARYTEEGRTHFQNADRAAESGQRFARLVRSELNARIDQLHALNRTSSRLPSAFAVSTAPGINQTGTASSHIPGSKSSTRANWKTYTANVSVNDLPEPEGITGSQDFQKVSEPDMKAGLLRLQEMQSLIDSGGAAANGDYWSKVDADKGLTYEHGYRRIYDTFYGNDAIRVTKDGDRYDIVNGRHRIWLAKQMGIDTLPMRVVERQHPKDPN